MENIKDLKKQVEKDHVYCDTNSERDVTEAKIETLQSVVRNLKRKIENLKRFDGYKGRLRDLIKEIEG